MTHTFGHCLNFRQLLRTLVLFLVLFVAPNAATAQRTPIEKYEMAPATFENVYIDHIKDFPCRIINMADNQYLGQVDKQGKLYGYGMFINGDGSQIIGKFRDNKLIFGITITQNAALVGEASHYASYSLSNARLEFIYRANERVLVDAANQLDHGFVTMKYANGDQYTGEVYQRQRHGYGIYYYENGDFWFGQYNHDIRSGFGALFHVDGNIEIGQWEGEDEKRVLLVKQK